MISFFQKNAELLMLSNPHKSLHFYIYASVNGVPVTELVNFSPLNSVGAYVVSAHTESPDYVGMKVDYWASNQSFPFLVSAKNVENWHNPWDIAAQRIKALISRLNPGKHSVKLELKYGVSTKTYPTQGYNPKIDYPVFDSFMSKFIASGEFTMDTSNSTVVLGRVFPFRHIGSLSNDSADAIEAPIKKLLDNSYKYGVGMHVPHPTKCISAILMSGWESYYHEYVQEISEKKWIKRSVSRHRVNCWITFYRNSKDGWPCSSCLGHFTWRSSCSTVC
jgi:hypothetical protein